MSDNAPAHVDADFDPDERQKVATEHRENALRRIGERQAPAAIDATDPMRGWTVQSGGDAAWSEASDSPVFVDPNQSQPGQVYHPSQLPDPEVARRAGFPPQQIPAALVIEDEEDAFSHPQGPNATELRQAVQRDAVLDHMRHDVEQREELRRAHEASVGLTPDERYERLQATGGVTYEDSQTRRAAMDAETDDGDRLDRVMSQGVSQAPVAGTQGGSVERDAVERAGRAAEGATDDDPEGSDGPDGAEDETEIEVDDTGSSEDNESNGESDDGGEADDNDGESTDGSDDPSPEMQHGDNPGDFTVDGVNAYLATVTDGRERRRVLNAEKRGAGRKGILHGPHGDPEE